MSKAKAKSTSPRKPLSIGNREIAETVNIKKLPNASQRIADARKRKLPRLSLTRLGLTELPKAVCELTHLRELNLQGNKLRSLPQALSQLTNLEKLYLAGNRFTSVPECIRDLKKLNRLGFYRNQLKRLPEWIGELKELRYLGVAKNRLQELPGSVDQLVQLQEFRAFGNDLFALPDSIRALTKLEKLYLGGNERLGLPPELTGSPSEVFRRDKPPPKAWDVLLYYFRTLHDARPLNEGKLILVGRGEVGKTCVVNRLVSDLFTDTSKTEGIQITLWEVPADMISFWYLSTRVSRNSWKS